MVMLDNGVLLFDYMLELTSLFDNVLELMALLE